MPAIGDAVILTLLRGAIMLTMAVIGLLVMKKARLTFKIKIWLLVKTKKSRSKHLK